MSIRSLIRNADKLACIKTSSKQVCLFIGLLLIVPLVAFSIVQLNGPEIRKNAFDNLNAIADLKTREIENWLAERRADLEFLASAEQFAWHAERLALSGNADSRAFVLRRLEVYSRPNIYHSAILLNSSGQIVARAGENNDTSNPATQQLLKTALKSGQIVYSDLYRDAITGCIHLDYILPLLKPGKKQAMVAVLFHTPAENFLFPLIQTWPTNSASAETMLARRDGNDALYLNELRHRHGTALSLRLPLDKINVPAIASILSNKAQIIEGDDYRGVPVFAATRQIAGTPWHLVAKIDREEVMAPLNELISWVSLLVSIAVTTIAFVIYQLWRQMLHTQQLELAARIASVELESEAKYRRLYESMSDAFVMVDMSGRVLDFNSAYREMLDYSNEELRSLNYNDLTPEKWHAFEAQVVEDQIIPQGQSQVYEKEYIHKNGTIFPVELRTFLLRDKNGQAEAMWSIVRNINERKRTEAELNQYRHHLEELVDARTRELEVTNSTLKVELDKLKKAEERLDSFNRDFEAFLDQTTDFIYFKDANSRIRFCSQTMAEITGHADWHEMIGKHDREIFPPDTARIYEEEEMQIFSEGLPVFNKTAPYYDTAGRLRYVQTSKWPLFNVSGKITGIFGISRDITEILAANQALKNAKEAAETATRSKSIFLSNMSHELRTPLNAILGFSDILRRSQGLSKEQQQNLAIIHKSGEHLFDLINDILELAKIEAGHIELKLMPFNLDGMISDVVEMLRLRAEEKGLQLLVDQSSQFPHQIVGDETKLRQIIINLLSNAIKATEKGGIVLRLWLMHNQADHILIEVEDTGCGIAPEDQARILDPFVQVGTQGKQQGTGLGLSITRQFVELMGGKLNFTSTVGKGSTFRVDIPVRPTRQEEVPQTPKASGKVTGLAPGQPAYRILVVEDHKENQLLLGNLLTKVGFEVQIAGNGAEAIEKFQHWRPHFIWMDWHMPVMDGVEATHRIRAMAGGNSVKIVAVTASSFKEQNNNLMMAGFDAIMYKPYRFEQILECMENLLGLHFEREQPESGYSPQHRLSAKALAALPETLRQKLAQALLILDGDRIMEVINEIKESDPELGAALLSHAQDYDYAPIFALLQAGRDDRG